MGTLGQHYIANWNFNGHAGRFQPIVHWNIEISMGTLVDLSQHYIAKLKFQYGHAGRFQPILHWKISMGTLVDLSQHYIAKLKFQWASWSIWANTAMEHWNFNGHVGRFEPILHWNIEISMGTLVDLSQYCIGTLKFQWARWANTTLQNWNFNGHAGRFQPILHWKIEISKGTLVDLSQHYIAKLKFQWARLSISANTTLENWNFNGHAGRFEPTLHCKIEISMGTLVDFSQYYIGKLKFQWARWSIWANTTLQNWNFNGHVGRFESILHWNIKISMGTLVDFSQYCIEKFQWARWSILANTTLQNWNFNGHAGRFQPILHWKIEISKGTLVDLSQHYIAKLKFQWARLSISANTTLENWNFNGHAGRFEPTLHCKIEISMGTLVDFSQYYIGKLKFQWARWSIWANTTLQNWNFNGHAGRFQPILHWKIEISMGTLVDLSQHYIAKLKFQWARWSIWVNTALEH